MDRNDHPRAFQISSGPLVSSRAPDPVEDESSWPDNQSQPLLLAVARNPRELFVCWSVDWLAEFEGRPPTDRQVHVRLRSGETVRSTPVEPLRGSIVIKDLDPGRTYEVELGYFTPTNQWHAVVAGYELMMPVEKAGPDDTVDYATLPLHLAFHRLRRIFDNVEEEAVAPALSRLETQAENGELTNNNKRRLARLDLTEAERERGTEQKRALKQAPTIRPPQTRSAAPSSWSS